MSEIASFTKNCKRQNQYNLSTTTYCEHQRVTVISQPISTCKKFTIKEVSITQCLLLSVEHVGLSMMT